MDNFYINTEEEILTLKKGLMHSKNSNAKSITDSIKQKINEEIGYIYEENLRQILKEQFKWTNADIPRKLYYILITIDNCMNIIITKECKKTLQYNNNTWTFIMKEQYVEISFFNNGKIQTVNFAHNSQSRIIYYVGTTVEIAHIAEK